MDTIKFGFSDEQQLNLATNCGVPVRLSNRHVMVNKMVRMIERAECAGTSFAVMLLGLNRFKMISNTLGNKISDHLILQVSERLKSVLEADDIIMHTCGTEFTVLLWDIKTPDRINDTHFRIYEALSQVFTVDGNALFISPSIGISIYPEHAVDAEGLLMTAGAAMFRANELGSSYYQLYSEEIGQNNLVRLVMEGDLRLGLERNEFKVHYQPIVDISTLQIVGAEALLRWNHPKKGMISPAVFIPIAEETGLISRLGEMVLETAIKQCKTWQNMGYSDFEMSVNASPVQLRQIGFIQEVHRALSHANLASHCLKIEVTETILSMNENDEMDILSILRSLGVKICIDDFGIGYSSLSRLKNMPVVSMKIDGSFIRNIQHDPNDKVVTASMITIAHSLGMLVTAECIEDEEQLAAVRSLQCDHAQGYLISAALPAEQFTKFIQDWTPDQLAA